MAFLKSFLFLTLVSLSALAAPKGNVEKGLAIHGYDPVSYLDGVPEKGKNELQSTFEGATYLFASQKNLQAFKSDPSRFEPQFKGWCAYAMADGEKVDVDPKTFKVVEGKVYLFYNGLFGNTLKKWNKDEVNLLKKANDKWKVLVKE